MVTYPKNLSNRVNQQVNYKKNKMQIYKITNKQTGLSYIGKDQNDREEYMGSGILIWNSYRKRFNRSDLDSKKKTHHRWVYEQNKIYKYYEKTILYICNDKDELCHYEEYFIDKYNTIRPNGYNIAIGGEGGNLIKGYTEEEKKELRNKISIATKQAMLKDDVREKFLNAVQNKSDEWKKHISESLTGEKGSPMKPEVKEKLRQINLGNKYGIGNKSRTGYHNSKEMNQRISNSLKNVVHTDEWNKKVSEGLKGKPKSEEHKKALRKPKPKYQWLLPDGSIRIMDASNGSRHDGWIKLEKVG